MSEWDAPKEDLGHPDSAIRLASAVHRFRVPKTNTDRKLAFARSFRSAGKHETSRRIILKADDMRKKLSESVSAGKVSHERVVADARRYQPLIHQILVSCKFQPEMARLDGTFYSSFLLTIVYWPKSVAYSLSFSCRTAGV